MQNIKIVDKPLPAKKNANERGKRGIIRKALCSDQLDFLLPISLLIGINKLSSQNKLLFKVVVVFVVLY